MTSGYKASPKMTCPGLGVTMAFPGWGFSSAGTQLPAAGVELHNWMSDLEDLEEGGDLCDEDDDAAAAEAPAEACSWARPPEHEGGDFCNEDEAAAAEEDWGDGAWSSDVLHCVLSHLDSPLHLCSARAVSRDWLGAASSAALWDAL